MKHAKNRVVANVALTLIALGGSISAAATRPGGWLVLLAFLVGFVCAWLVFGSLMAYAQRRAAARMLKQKQGLAALAALIQKNQGAADPAASSTTPEGTES